MNFSSSLENVKGVGKRSLDDFHQAGLFTVSDLMNFFPRGYEDYQVSSVISDLKPGRVTISAEVESVTNVAKRRGMTLTLATLKDSTEKIQAVWFNQAYRKKQLEIGKTYIFTGDYKFSYGKYQLISPSAIKAEEMTLTTSDKIVPVYKAIGGIKQKLIIDTITKIKPLFSVVPEEMPNEIIKNNDLMALSDSYSQIHQPDSIELANKAKERFSFDELFCLLISSRLNKDENNKLESYKMSFDLEATKKIINNLPFKLTADQKIALWEIIQDFEKKTPMNRLLQGDVGSGKTVVAGLASVQAYKNGYQCAFLAPTEILASQHAETLNDLLSPLGIKVGLLVGSLKTKAKKEFQQRISNGEIDVVVGTHALLQDAVLFRKLGFVVIDEQHRFGVKQRKALLTKSYKMPHLLAMTATPIPRTLALTLYGEMDISLIKTKPVGRKPIITKVHTPVTREKVYEKVKSELDKGRQGYLICNLIEDNPDNERKSVLKEYENLSKTTFKDYRLAVMHGKLTGEEKDKIMSKFLNHEIDLLISTTVIEVGVNVPNASFIIIENGDHFGLSQLHQLRGRVGRSSDQGYCYIITSKTEALSKRLKVIEKSEDGFYLAEEDLKIRGPGEIYGSQQHGDLNLKIASLADSKLIKRAKNAVDFFMDNNYSLDDYPELRNKVKSNQKVTTLN